MKKLYQSYKLIILPYCVKTVANWKIIFKSKLFSVGQVCKVLYADLLFQHI